MQTIVAFPTSISDDIPPYDLAHAFSRLLGGRLQFAVANKPTDHTYGLLLVVDATTICVDHHEQDFQSTTFVYNCTTKNVSFFNPGSQGFIFSSVHAATVDIWAKFINTFSYNDLVWYKPEYEQCDIVQHIGTLLWKDKAHVGTTEVDRLRTEVDRLRASNANMAIYFTQWFTEKNQTFQTCEKENLDTKRRLREFEEKTEKFETCKKESTDALRRLRDAAKENRQLQAEQKQCVSEQKQCASELTTAVAENKELRRQIYATNARATVSETRATASETTCLEQSAALKESTQCCHKSAARVQRLKKEVEALTGCNRTVEEKLKLEEAITATLRQNLADLSNTEEKEEIKKESSVEKYSIGSVNLKEARVVAGLTRLIKKYLGVGDNINDTVLGTLFEQTNRMLAKWDFQIETFNDLPSVLCRMTVKHCQMTVKYKTMCMSKKIDTPFSSATLMFEHTAKNTCKQVQTFENNGREVIDSTCPETYLQKILNVYLDKRDVRGEFLADKIQTEFLVPFSLVWSKAIRTTSFNLSEYSRPEGTTVDQLVEQLASDLWYEFKSEFHRSLIFLREKDVFNRAVTIPDSGEDVRFINLVFTNHRVIQESLMEACNRRMDEIMTLSATTPQWEDQFLRGVPIHGGRAAELEERLKGTTIAVEDMEKEYGLDAVSARALWWKYQE